RIATNGEQSQKNRLQKLEMSTSILQKNNPSCPLSSGPGLFVLPTNPDCQVLEFGSSLKLSRVESDVSIDGSQYYSSLIHVYEYIYIYIYIYILIYIYIYIYINK